MQEVVNFFPSLPFLPFCCDPCRYLFLCQVVKTMDEGRDRTKASLSDSLVIAGKIISDQERVHHECIIFT